MEDSNKQLVYLAIIALTVIDLILIVYGIFYPVSGSFRYYAMIFDLMVCAVMWVEFIYSYLQADDRKHFLKDNSLSILGMLPINFAFFRILRLVKLIQLIKVYVVTHETTGDISKFLRHTYLDKIILLAVIFVFAIAILITIVDSNISNLKDALWYMLVTVTSTGYGDVVPASPSGRILGMIAMVGGILIFASFTAVISSLYVSRINRNHHEDLESKIEELTAEIEKLNKKIDDL